MRLAATVALIAIAGSLHPASGMAQRLSFAPEIGVYIPTEHLVEATDGTVGELEVGLSLGGRLGLWFGDRIGLSVSGGYVPTTFAFSPSGGPTEQRDAKLFNGAGQLVVFLLPPRSLLSLFLTGGVGVVSRGGVAFTDAAETTNLTGVVGLGASIRLGGISLNAGSELFAYNAEYDAGGLVSEQLSQKDIQIRLGFGIPFGGGMGAIR